MRHCRRLCVLNRKHDRIGVPTLDATIEQVPELVLTEVAAELDSTTKAIDAVSEPEKFDLRVSSREYRVCWLPVASATAQRRFRCTFVYEEGA